MAFLSIRGKLRGFRSSMQGILCRLAAVGQLTARHSNSSVNQPLLPHFSRLASGAVLSSPLKNFSSSQATTASKEFHTRASFSSLRHGVAPQNALTLYRTAEWRRKIGGALPQVCRSSGGPLSTTGRTFCRQPDGRWLCYRFLSLASLRHQGVRRFNSQAWLNRRER